MGVRIPELEGQVSPPSAMVIFGASGDLTRRKLIPALYNLARNNLLSKQFILVGSRGDRTLLKVSVNISKRVSRSSIVRR